MDHPLQHRVRQVRRWARTVLIVQQGAATFAVILAAVMIAGLVDFFLSSEETGVRIILAVAALSASSWVIYAWLIPALRAKLSEVQVAQRIERHFPELQARLSSSLEFLAQSEQDVTAGSAQLRRTVVAETSDIVESLPLQQVIDFRRPLPMLGAFGGGLLVVALFAAFAPAASWQAARRLVQPWSEDPWPRVNQLEIVEAAQQVPLGETFRVVAKDRNGNLPGLVNIYYWFEGSDVASIEPQKMQTAGDRAVHELSRVTKPFQFRLVGGDDATMPWIKVAVVEPPRVAELKVTLTPPPYSGWPVETSGPNIRALAQTQLRFEGVANQPIKAARLLLQGAEAEDSFDAHVDGKQLRFTIPKPGEAPLLLSENGSYRLELTGVDGVVGKSEVWQVEVLPDGPPRIALESPEPNVYITPQGVLKVQGSVKDDLAIANIELRFSRSDRSDEGEETVTLFEQQQPRSILSKAIDGASLSREELAHVEKFDYAWDLAKLSELNPGTSLLFSIVARDFKPQEERTAVRRVNIITVDQLDDRIAQRQAYLLGQLAEALKSQRDVRAQTGAIKIQFEQVPRVSDADLVDLQSAELNQRQVGRLLVGEEDGALLEIDALLALLDQNRIDSPDVRRRMQSLQQALRGLAAKELPAVQRELIDSIKTAQAASQAAEESQPLLGETKAALDRAIVAQEEVVAKLSELLGGLSQWDNYSRFAREVSRFKREQEAIRQRTSDARSATISKELHELTDQQRADLAKLGERQQELARELDRTLGTMSAMGDELREKEPLAAETLGDAVDAARSAALSGRMQQSGRQIENNQLGQAADNQQQVMNSLDEVLATLAGRREHELGRLAEKLKQAQSELADLQQRQKGLQEKAKAAANSSNLEERRKELERLAKEQSQLAEEAARLARKLERLTAEGAADSLQRAGEQLMKGSEAAARKSPAGQQSAGERATKDLEDAARQLAQSIAEVEQDLMQEQLARLEQSLKGMIEQQQGVLDETERLEALRQRQGELSRGQQASLRSLASRQRGLIDEVNDFAEKIAPAEVFYLGLTGAAAEMSRAAQELERDVTSTVAQQFERNALSRLTQLATALQQDADLDPSPQEAGEAGGDGAGEQNAARDGIQHLAQLKLLRLMQDALRRRTEELQDAKFSVGRWTAEQLVEVERLAAEQGKLADLMFKLSQPVDTPPEDDPTLLPDLRDDNEKLETELQDAIERALRDANEKEKSP